MDCISHVDLQELGHGETCFLVDTFGRPINPDASSIFEDELFGLNDMEGAY